VKASAPNGQSFEGGVSAGGTLFETGFSTITQSIMVRFYFSKCLEKDLDEIYQKTPFLG